MAKAFKKKTSKNIIFMNYTLENMKKHGQVHSDFSKAFDRVKTRPIE